MHAHALWVETSAASKKRLLGDFEGVGGEEHALKAQADRVAYPSARQAKGFDGSVGKIAWYNVDDLCREVCGASAHSIYVCILASDVP